MQWLRTIEEHLEQLIDESLEETFPASDPPRPALTVMADSIAPRSARPDAEQCGHRI